MGMLIHGDCLEELKKLPSDSIDSLVTDPPAGISFMGKAWDDDKGGRKQWVAWMESVMRECIRVMKPGAHGLVWALPRTSHWTAMALEDAGFEVRDCVYHLFGSGFPKSHNISKAIDFAAGAERAVIGYSRTKDIKRNVAADIAMGKTDRQSKFGTGSPSIMIDHPITAPSTDAAKQWQGFGTALKPANEHWLLVRKPCSEKTVAANVLKWGTGALNIDGSRIEGHNPSTERRKSAAPKSSIGATGWITPARPATYNDQRPGEQLGRFPANLVLSHSPHCAEDQCDIECAVAMLDSQSGLCPSATNKGPTKSGGIWGVGSSPQFENGAPYRHEKATGASRFFYCAKTSKRERNSGLDKSELIWKSGAWERPDLNSRVENISRLAKGISADLLEDASSWNTDLYGHSISEQYPLGFRSTIETAIKLITELRTSSSSQLSSTNESIRVAIETMEASGLSLAESVAFINQLSLDTIRERAASLLSAVRALLPELLGIRGFARSGNFHETVKPQKLMRYLCKLITPPGGTVLDPFMGSGSTGLAAKSEGFGFIGIEREPEYFEIASKRIEWG